MADGRCARLVDLLLHWQWPDGGWNCDRNPAAETSSFFETLLPMRGLRAHGTAQAQGAARAAAEVFLTRRLPYRTSTGALIRDEFTKLHYPLYWHYDILGGLEAMMEPDLLDDPRCADALDLLESMRLADAGRPKPGSTARRPTSRCTTTGSIGTARARDGPTRGSPPTR